MKGISIIAAVALGLTFLFVAYSQRPKPFPPINRPPVTEKQTVDQKPRLAETIATQRRINRYFHGDVVPKLKGCWGNVKGKATITFEYHYSRHGGDWTWRSLRIANSTLPAGEDAVALKCMENSMRGTRFSGAGAELQQNNFVLYWTWPVPFPADADVLTAAMFTAKGGSGSGTGGCDGNGAAAKCYNCVGLTCSKVCVGYQTCEGNNEGCVAVGACASGGPFGVGGGRVIAF